MTGTEGVRGRLAPSPTGCLHLGNAYAFLAAWLSIRSQGGTLVLRMEDIDPDRSRAAFADAIMQDLHWLGLDWDEGPGGGAGGGTDGGAGSPHAPYCQSERLERYERALDELTAQGFIYPCYCTRKELRTLASAPHIGDEGAPYPGTCRTLCAREREAKERSGRRPAMRLNVDAAMAAMLPEGAEGTRERIAFDDLALGPCAFDFVRCGGDFALRRSDGVFSYQLAVSVDDAAMGITEVLRGEDLLLSTPRQILLHKLLGAPPPRYAHIPLLLDSKGERLAKRHRSLELRAIREQGIPAASVTGLIAHLAGWISAPEPVSAAELLPLFSLRILGGRALTLPEPLVFP